MIQGTIEASQQVKRNLEFSLEERLAKCIACQQELFNFGNILSEMSSCHGKLGRLIEETLQDISLVVE